MPGCNKSSGLVPTTILGIRGAFLATWLDQTRGWYRPGEGTGLVGVVVGAIFVLLIWGALSRRGGT